MRIHEGNYAYEIRQKRDPLTQLTTAWTYIIYEVHPVDQAVESRDVASRQEAERQAKSRLTQLLRQASHPQVA